ncbi:helicase associated domain (HA2) domain-containing protein [Phthorimaea operculella]|nr:helicase associated domain (HA2) domain-containing protein [Phthorimaea operculella]
MFWRSLFARRTNLYKTHVSLQVFNSKSVNLRNYSACISSTFRGRDGNQSYFTNYPKLSSCFSLQRHYCSKGLLDGDVTGFQETQREKELHKITQLFPNPRVTLNEFTAKTPDKVFEIHYKQNMSAPKIGRKKQKPQANGWTCTYAFVWPEKIKFEATALSKRLAAEKAAIQAIHYLHLNNHIDNKGHPVYDRDKIKELKDTIQEPMRINVSQKSMERIDRIWEDYESGIKDIYDRTFKDAANKMIATSPTLTKDSTIDEDDGFTESETKVCDDEVDDILDQKVHIHPVYGKTVTPPSETVLQRRERLLVQKFQRYDEELSPALPIDNYVDQITSTLETSRVAVIVGAAGCGKSTRGPAAVLRHLRSKADIIVSEPRRVAARGLAERVAFEMGEEVGETIGYQVRLQARPPRPPAGGLLYCTSGVLLRRLQANPGLTGCTHVFIDEAHERDVNTDITLLLLKRALELNPELHVIVMSATLDIGVFTKALELNPKLHVIVMSATLDIGVFTKYFDACPVIEVPGRAYPVQVTYLDEIEKQFNIILPATRENCQKEDGRPYINCQEIVEVIKSVDRTQPDGAMLVFLPGWAEIQQTKQLLNQTFSESTHSILPVHSRLSTSDQVKIFSKPPPGVRKIVLATNIAETSITINDVVYVIDAGAHKENRIKEGTATASLETVWVSLAGAKQRQGRAGRVQPGHCYKLYTREKEAELTPHTTPEILRVPLDQTVLDCKSYAPEDKVEDFLSNLPEPPTHKAIQFAVNDLIDLGALTPSEQMTRVGHILSSMPLAPRLGRALLHSAVAGNVLTLANVLTHCQDNQQLFSNSVERREAPRLGRALLHSAVAGNVLTLANVLTHCQDNQQLFSNSVERREEIREFKSKYSDTSDHAALHWIQDEFEQRIEEGWSSVDEWCGQHGLRKERLRMVKWSKYGQTVEEEGWSSVDEWCGQHGLRKERLRMVKYHAALHWIQDEFEQRIEEEGWSGVDEWCGQHGLRKERLRMVKFCTKNWSDTSDHAALHWIQDEFEQRIEEGWSSVDEWCGQHGLRKERLRMVKSLSNLYLEHLLKCGILEPTIEPEELNRFSEIDEITCGILLSGSNALLKTKRQVKTKGKLKTATELFTSTGDRAHIGSESVNYHIAKRKPNTLLTYFGGLHSTERRALVVYMTSIVPPHTALLFCMGDIKKEVLSEGDEEEAILSLPKHKLHVHMTSSQADHILKAREMLWNTFQYYINRDMKTLDYEENTRISRFKVRLLKAIGRVLVEGHREYVQGKKIEEFVDR